MELNKKHLEEVLAYIRQHRGNEANFEALYTKLVEECDLNTAYVNYKKNLEDIKEKQAEAYRQTNKTNGTAWPEFENFVSEFERAITAAMKEVE